MRSLYTGVIVLALPLLVLSAASCGGSSTTEVTKDYFDDPVREYPLRGEIISIDRENKIAKIKHENIGDWMGAMTMDFPVENDAALAQLQEGEMVTGTVSVQGIKYWIDEIGEAGGAASTPGGVNASASEPGQEMDHPELDQSKMPDTPGTPH